MEFYSYRPNPADSSALRALFEDKGANVVDGSDMVAGARLLKSPLELEVRIELDRHAKFLPEVEGIVPTSLTRTETKDEPGLRVRRVTLKAGETSKVGFPAFHRRRFRATV